MSSYLKYLDNYVEQGNDVVIHLKDFPSTRKAGLKITRELFISLFHDETLQLNRVHEIAELTYLVQKNQQYFCLNCREPIFFKDNFATCKRCAWRNDLSNAPLSDISPITLKTNSLKKPAQIAYPLIQKKDLDRLPEGLKGSINKFFMHGEDFSKKDYDNIYHNLFKKDGEKFLEIACKYESKAKLSEFFKSTNLFK